MIPLRAAPPVGRGAYSSCLLNTIITTARRAAQHVSAANIIAGRPYPLLPSQPDGAAAPVRADRDGARRALSHAKLVTSEKAALFVIRAVLKMTESADDNIRNVTAAMTRAAPKMAALREGIARGAYHDMDITADLGMAAGKLSTLREQGQTVDDYLRQEGLFGNDLTDVQREIIGMLARHARSAKRIGDIFTRYADKVIAAGSPKQGALFGGELTPPAKETILREAEQEVASGVGRSGQQDQGTLFNQAPLAYPSREPYGGTASAGDLEGDRSGESGRGRERPAGQGLTPASQTQRKFLSRLKSVSYDSQGEYFVIRKQEGESPAIPAGHEKVYENTARLFVRRAGAHNAEAEMARGADAMERVIRDQTDVQNAMRREGLGDVSFYWGEEGSPEKEFKDGYGIAHLIARRNSEGQDGIAVARRMVEVIALGEITNRRGPKSGERVDVKHGGHTAVLSLYRHGKKETWVLTGWKDFASDEPGGGYGPPGPTLAGPMRARPGEGAEADNNILSVQPERKPLESRPVESPGAAYVGLMRSEENAGTVLDHLNALDEAKVDPAVLRRTPIRREDILARSRRRRSNLKFAELSGYEIVSLRSQ